VKNPYSFDELTFTINKTNFSNFSPIDTYGYYYFAYLSFRTWTNIYASFENSIYSYKHIFPNGTEENLIEGSNTIDTSTLGTHKIVLMVDVYTKMHATSNSVESNQPNAFKSFTYTVTYSFVVRTSSSEIDQLNIYSVLSRLINVTPTRFIDSEATK